MSKKEGEILKFAIKKAGLTVQEFAEKLGYKGRTALNYQFVKDNLDYEFKERAARALGVNVQTLFEQPTAEYDANNMNDGEKAALKKLVEAQESLLRHQNEFITAQLIRNEAFESVMLAKIAEIQSVVVPTLKGKQLDVILEEAEQDVADKIQEIRKELGLAAS